MGYDVSSNNLYIYNLYSPYNNNLLALQNNGVREKKTSLLLIVRRLAELETDVMLLYLCMLALLTFSIFRTLFFWYHRIVVIGTQVDKLPGDARHWLYGNRLKVSMDVTNAQIKIKTTKTLTA